MAASTKSLEGIIPFIGGSPDVVFTIPLDPATGGVGASSMTPVATTAASGFQIAKAGPGKLYGLNVVAGATAGYVLVYDAVAAPVDGATTPKKVFQLAANASLDRTWDRGLIFTTGIVIVFSSTGPFTKTISNTAFIETEVV
ncbi:hypothetical protein [Rhizobium tumorigenes]|uniref:hypothetical protein n=1 Tax=Rhizobium tumorigenes TaxID=2041385 RepID=UPI00241CEB7A|nr:hypothetical protein [Rhizobium tumorigenes]WFS02225.1 hypothetical protein PR016_06320 [Rhizobium tumorigenes]